MKQINWSTIRTALITNADQFRPGFIIWVRDNISKWDAISDAISAGKSLPDMPAEICTDLHTLHALLSFGDTVEALTPESPAESAVETATEADEPVAPAEPAEKVRYKPMKK